MNTKIALITGATAGIGKGIAYKLAAENYKLIITGRRADRLEELADSLTNNFGIEVLTLNFDIRNRVETETVLKNLPEKWKAVEVLINNAGLAAGLDPVQTANVDDWDQMIDTNVKGLLYASSQLIPQMVAAKKGHIVNIGSIAGKETYAKGAVYCASKHAVDAITKGMRIDLLEFGIKVTAINPGMVETEFSEVRFKGDTTTAKKVYKGFTPLDANDIAEAVWFVLSRPAHVNINDMIIMPTAQASATNTFRNE
ncbi:MAG TPA: NAD(P)-dependent oxidoreductase [Bacteroidales bacterium]|nr:NAD(P)-dependent oxidoreductase [Bacteroidales bacterium]